MIVVHVTHEAVEKIGGIGAVIAGLMTADAYAKNVSRTILLGPLLRTDQPVNRRLGEGGHVLYSTLDAIQPPPWSDRFRPIERTYDVGIIYGTRSICDPYSGKCVQAEVLLVNVFHANRDRLNQFKGQLFKNFAVPSERFENIWEYEEYVRLAEPGYEALKVIGANGTQPGGKPSQEQVIYLSHEYMGMPLALRVVMSGSHNSRTVFYAHEVASVRPIVEKVPGHDTMFYNTLQWAEGEGKTMEDIFPAVFENYKHPLVKAARYCDHVFAVGDYVESELRFLDPHFRTMDVDLVYNGVPALPLTLEEKHASRDRMRRYALSLLGRLPTWVFTHVCRPVLSKGIWRDLRVLHEMENMLKARGETAVYFMLGTLGGERRFADVRHMERVYGWPVTHEVGYPDLCGGEEVLGEMVDHFNREHQAIRAVLVNQWGWNRQVCGDRMAEEMTFSDIRRGSDLEFGLSVYEPFGISQFEALCFGAICVPSNVCGCMGFARKLADGGLPIHDNIIEGNYLRLPSEIPAHQALHMTIAQRDLIEEHEGRRLAGLLAELLPRDDQTMLRRIQSGYNLAEKMSWEHVVNEYFLPSLAQTISRP